MNRAVVLPGRTGQRHRRLVLPPGVNCTNGGADVFLDHMEVVLVFVRRQGEGREALHEVRSGDGGNDS